MSLSLRRVSLDGPKGEMLGRCSKAPEIFNESTRSEVNLECGSHCARTG